MTTIKTMLLFASLTMLELVGNAQEKQYIPLVEPGKVWFETYSQSPSPYGYNTAGKVYLQGDTIINNVQFSKIYSMLVDVLCQETIILGPIYRGAMRDDTIEKKIWIVEPNESDEILFFDFSLETGDTIPETCYFSRQFYPIVISSIDTVITYDGVERSRWQFECEGSQDGSIVIEGIGSINGFLAGYILPFEYYSEDLFCCTLDSMQIFPYSSSDCILPSDTCAVVGLPEPETMENIIIFPNPLSNSQQLHFQNQIKEDDEITKIIIIDTNGTIVLISEFWENHVPLNLPDYLSGLYVLKIITKKHVYINKIKIL